MSDAEMELEANDFLDEADLIVDDLSIVYDAPPSGYAQAFRGIVEPPRRRLARGTLRGAT